MLDLGDNVGDPEPAIEAYGVRPIGSRSRCGAWPPDAVGVYCPAMDPLYAVAAGIG